MSEQWKTLLFETCLAGASSAVAPELLLDSQVAWGGNIDIRGGKPATRPSLSMRLDLPNGLVQGGEYFGVQGGMMVLSIGGKIYRIRINNRLFTAEQIALTFNNSSIIKQVWMCQTVEMLVIQDYQSNAILYNGSTAVRSTGQQVPRGRQMAYGNGRLWLAIDANELVAGDIRNGNAGSELMFTETNYLSGGGAFFFPRGISGLAFIPVTGQADYGALLAFATDFTNALRADVTSRDQWATIPGFEQSILRSVGAASQWTIVAVNQDLYWRDSNGGIRSIRNALVDEMGPGSSPVSREVSRLVDYDSQQLMEFCSGIYFDNRLLMTSSPYLLPNGGVAWKDLISLDFAPLSTMQGKSPAAYNGQWTGLNIVKLISGDFQGKNRAFAITTDPDGANRLWELGTNNRADERFHCDDGVDTLVESPITCWVEYPLRNMGVSKNRKRLERCDVWLSAVDGPLDLQVYWRPDNAQKWLKWDEAEVCAATTDPTTNTPHVWRNLLGQERPQLKTFTIPDSINGITTYATRVGFEFQIRLVWTGRCRIHRVMAYGTVLDDPNYALRENFPPDCLYNDITGNNVEYVVPLGGCPFVGGLPCGGIDDFGDAYTDPIFKTYEITNTGTEPLIFGTALISGNSGFTISQQPTPSTIDRGETSIMILEFNPLDQDSGEVSAIVQVVSNDPNSPCVFQVTANVGITFEQFDGPFVFPGFLFRDPGIPPPGSTGSGGGWGGSGSTGPAFYRDQRISGSNSSKTTLGAFYAGVSECAIGAYLPGGSSVGGVANVTFGGEYTYDGDFSGSGTGIMNADANLHGLMPGPNYYPYEGFLRSVSADTADNLFAVMNTAGIPLVAQSVQTEFYSDEYFVRFLDNEPAYGWFVGTGVYQAWCDSSLEVNYTKKAYVVDLGYTVARTGQPARTQNSSGGNTYSDSPNTFTGNKSRAVITKTIPAGATSISLDWQFTVTPDVGAPYVITGNSETAVSPGDHYTQAVEFPWILGAKVYMDYLDISYLPSQYDAFGTYQDGEYTALPASASWNSSIIFGMIPPDGLAWDDLSGYTGPDGVINQLTSGYGWLAIASFSSVDYVEADDDLETYPVGTIVSIGGGIGWLGIGFFGTVDYTYADDDLESYSSGTITSLDGGSLPPVGWWVADGAFGT